jgi:hypothetical protein
MSKIGDGLRVQDPDVQVGSSALDGIREARGFYGRLGRRIRAIHTSSGSKADVLDAIKRLDRGLALFARGLRSNATDEGLSRITDAADQTEAAAADLAKATNAIT